MVHSNITESLAADCQPL